MEYVSEKPNLGVKHWLKPLFDAHIHIWKPEKSKIWNPTAIWKMFLKWVNIYYGNSIYDLYFLGMMQPEIKKEFPEELSRNIIFAYYLSVKAFALFDTKKLLEEVDLAHTNDYDMIKLWFAPRMIDYAKGEPGFRLNDSKFEKIYEKIEDYDFKTIIHVADPDLWYLFKYGDHERYGTKKQRIDDFCEILERYKKIEFISAHLGSWPENLHELGIRIDKYPNFYLDTASTRWIIRELGKNKSNSKKWITKYANKGRILFGSDLSLAERINPEYFTTRYWSHKIFWETNYTSNLPFNDTDNPFGTKIHGLQLEEQTLDKIYYKNAFKLFNINS